MFVSRINWRPDTAVISCALHEIYLFHKGRKFPNDLLGVGSKTLRCLTDIGQRTLIYQALCDVIIVH